MSVLEFSEKLHEYVSHLHVACGIVVVYAACLHISRLHKETR